MGFYGSDGSGWGWGHGLWLASEDYADKVLGYSPSIYYMMAEASGATAIDSSGNSFDGTYADVTLGQTGIGDGRTSCDFDGSASILTTPDISSVFDGDEYSIAFWAQVDDWTVNADNFIRWYYDSSNYVNINIQTAAAGRISHSRKATSFKDAYSDASGSPAGSVWFHVAATCSALADEMLVYYNAVVGGNTGTAAAWAGAETVLEIGARIGPTNVLDGRMAHMGIFFGTVLEQADITDLATV